MQGRTIAAQPVLSQRVEREPVSRAEYFTNLFVWCIGRIMRQEWIPVDAKCDTVAKHDAFESVRHEHRILNHANVVRDEDSSAIAATVRVPTAQRHHGQRGRLLSFKKPQ